MRLARGSTRYVGLALLAAAAVFPFSWRASVACVVIAAGVLYFHRDPARRPPTSGVVAPADGTVKVIREEDGRLRLGIYMSGWDVHVNRAPMDGVVETVEHVPGANKLAFTKESEKNERLRFAFEKYTVEMIAGTFARRTHAYVESGDEVERGQRIGHISFGSRFDMVFPPEYDREDLTVARGHRLFGGETVIAREAPAADERRAESEKSSAEQSGSEESADAVTPTPN